MSDPSRGLMRRPADYLLVGGVTLVGLLLGLATLERRPDRVATADFLLADQSLNLLVADDLLAGKVLYRDLFYQYGPLPAYSYAGFAGLFGNTIRSYALFYLVTNLLILALVTVALRRAVSAGTAAFVALMGVLPTFFTPGALFGAYTSSAYIPLERLCLVVLTLLWAPPQHRSAGRSVGLGVVLGIWQAVKFGGAAFAGLALVALDLLALALVAGSWRAWLGRLTATLGAFLAVEGALAAWAITGLPGPVALDALWPQFMLDQYASVEASSLPVWVGWQGWRYAAGQLLTPAVDVALGLIVLIGLVGTAVRARTGRAATGADLGGLHLLLPFVFFAFASAGYFRHGHLTLQHTWAACLAGALLVEQLPRKCWPVLFLVWLPGTALIIKAELIDPVSPRVSPLELPTGERVFVNPQERELIQATLAGVELARSRGGPPPRVIIMTMGAGVHHFYGLPRSSRHVWYLAGFIRPHEEDSFIASLDDVQAIIFLPNSPTEELPADPCESFNRLFDRPLFSARICDAFRRRFGEPVKISSRCWVFPGR